MSDEIIEPGKALAVETPAALPALPAVSQTMAMISQALDRGAGMDVVEKLIALQERMEANEARKAFVAAMAQFKAVKIEIFKQKKVAFGDTEYHHATLDKICAAVGPELARAGLSYRWKTEHLDAGTIQVTCIVRHALGHNEETTLRAGADNSGKKNGVQAIGSTVSYLSRYTLLAALGLATADQDDDGAGSSAGLFINEVQLSELQEALAETASDVANFCKMMGVEFLAEIKVKDLPGAYKAIDAKRRALAQKGGAK